MFCKEQNQQMDTFQLAIKLEEIGIKSDFFEDWEEERLNTTLGRQYTHNTESTISATTTGMQVVPRETQPQPPITNLYQTERIFMEGAETKCKTNEALQQAKPAKYIERKTIHFLDFCGLKLNEHHLLPEIWKTLQENKELVR